jgi:hypothetical protein
MWTSITDLFAIQLLISYSCCQYKLNAYSMSFFQILLESFTFQKYRLCFGLPVSLIFGMCLKHSYSFPVADNLYFNGSALVRWDLMRDPISASRESIKFRFKTSVANGVLMYSRGTQGDYIALQLRDNRMLLNIDLGM